MKKIAIQDDGVMYRYRMALFDYIASIDSNTKYLIIAEGFEGNFNAPNIVACVHECRTKFGIKYHALTYYREVLSADIRIFSTNWRYPLNIIFGCALHGKFWGGGFKKSTSLSMLLVIYLFLLNIFSSSLMLYENQLLKFSRGKRFRNISQFEYDVPDTAVDPKIIEIVEKIKTYALFVGRIDRNKGIVDYLEKSLDFNDGVNYLVVGDGPLSGVVDSLVNRFPNLVRLPKITRFPDLKYIFSHCRVIISPGQTGLLAEDANYFRKQIITIDSKFSGPEAFIRENRYILFAQDYHEARLMVLRAFSDCRMFEPEKEGKDILKIEVGKVWLEFIHDVK